MDAADVSRVPAEVLRNVEADTYWCVSRLLDGIQVSARPGAGPGWWRRRGRPASGAPSAAEEPLPRVTGCARTRDLGLGLVAVSCWGWGLGLRPAAWSPQAVTPPLCCLPLRLAPNVCCHPLAAAVCVTSCARRNRPLKGIRLGACSTRAGERMAPCPGRPRVQGPEHSMLRGCACHRRGRELEDDLLPRRGRCGACQRGRWPGLSPRGWPGPTLRKPFGGQILHCAWDGRRGQ